MTTEVLEIERLTDNPEYAAALETLNRLKQERTQLEIDLQNRRDNLKGATKLEAEIEAIIAGQPLRGVVTDERIAEDLAQMGHRRNVLRIAIEQQQATADKIAMRVSEAVARQIEPQYRLLVSRQLSALLELAEASSEVSGLLQELAEAGITSGGVLRPMQFTRLGTLAEENSWLFHHVAELMREGVLTDDEVADAGVPRGAISTIRRRLSQR